ncbi:serine/threonine-protein kinase [Plantactinospora solaniradicis]|uniref:non-specific serine/threonine protein kinase n=1 Tax=Plantactinospora solaniradicis TaxID=1723736 RepID=A0ABW1JZX2_9ACTN
MAALQAGGLLARRYRLIDRIGAGGMSVIWRARDEVLDRVVAVKVLAASLAADTKFREMVREEARAAAQLVHPHVTAVHDYGETVGPDGGITAFVVMELLTGEELKAELTAGPLPWMTAVEICAQVSEALAAAHRLGIVHRDITPANIMMTATGAKVLDFGIATQVGAPDEDEDGETFGTPAYVAPERLDGLPAQPATDTYSLGVLLYETLTGRVPFPADTWEELTRAMEAGTEPTLTGVPDLPPVVADVCLRCLSREPAERPTAAQVGEALRGQLLAADPRRLATGRPRSGTVPTARLAALPATAAGPASAALAATAAPAAPARGEDPAPVHGSPTGRVEAGAAGPHASVGRSPADSPGSAGAPGTGMPHRSSANGPPTGTAPGGPPPAGPPEPAGGLSVEPPRPGRVLLFAAAALVVLTVAVVVASALGGEPRSRPNAGATTAGPGGTPGPGTPSSGTSAPSPAPASPAAPQSAPPPRRTGGSEPSAPPINEAIARVDQLVDDGVAASAIRDHAGVDLRNQLRNLRSGLAAGPGDLAGQVTLLREKVAVRRDEGSISPEYAEQLDAALVRLAQAV